MDGEELIGAKQNRIMNTDVLLRPHARKLIPVSNVTSTAVPETTRTGSARAGAPLPGFENTEDENG